MHIPFCMDETAYQFLLLFYFFYDLIFIYTITLPKTKKEKENKCDRIIYMVFLIFHVDM